MPPLSLLQAYGSRQKKRFYKSLLFWLFVPKKAFFVATPLSSFCFVVWSVWSLKVNFFGVPKCSFSKKNQGKQDKVGIFPSREGGQLFPHLPAIIPQKKWIFFLCLGKIPTFSHFFVSDVPYLAFLDKSDFILPVTLEDKQEIAHNALHFLALPRIPWSKEWHQCQELQSAHFLSCFFQNDMRIWEWLKKRISLEHGDF